MDQQAASDAPFSGDAQSFLGDVSSEGSSGPSYGLSGADGTGDRNENAVGNALVDLIPPAMVVAVVLFWMFAPRSVIDNEWTLVATGAFITFFVLGLEWLFERHEGWRLTKPEFATDLFYMLLSYSAISWASQRLAEQPLAAAKATFGISTEWMMQLPFLVQVAAVVFLIEFGQYWMHRLMHNSHPFWLTHAPHHHITQLNAMKGYVGNPIELFLISLSVVALFDFDIAAIFCAINILGVVSTFAHANVRSNPPLFYSFFFTTIRHHSLHHSVGYEETRCNYANSLIVIDRVFGTYREGESAIVGQDERRRLSIWEQFLFPFQPVIDRIRAKRSKSVSSAN